jgi:hypothetical protein
LGPLPPDSAPLRRRAIVAIAVGAVTIDSALLGLIAPLLPEIEQRTGAGDAALGLALAAGGCLPLQARSSRTLCRIRKAAGVAVAASGLGDFALGHRGPVPPGREAGTRTRRCWPSCCDQFDGASGSGCLPLQARSSRTLCRIRKAASPIRPPISTHFQK